MADFMNQTDNQAIVAEEFVPFDREVSLIGTRGKDGSIVIYPLTENVHTHGVLSLSTALVGNDALQAQAEAMFEALADTLNYVGVLAIEFFDVDGQLLVNEIAPRVHNSGHWTQQGAETCQFENHLRAVTGLPLGSTRLIRPTAMINILGEELLPTAILADPHCHIHWYGKEKRPGRKMGHINCVRQPQKRCKMRCVMWRNISIRWPFLRCSETKPAQRCSTQNDKSQQLLAFFMHAPNDDSGLLRLILVGVTAAIGTL